VRAAIATMIPGREAELDAYIAPLLRDDSCFSLDPLEERYERAWAALVLAEGDADRFASELFDADHPDADYLRLMLAGTRALRGDRTHAQTIIDARWQQAQSAGAPENWLARARQGDMLVWHEALIAVWADAKSAQWLRDVVGSEESVVRAGFAQLGLSLSSLRTEAYFYLGLKAAVEGRGEEARELWQLVEAHGRPEYYEFAVARYFSRALDSHAGSLGEWLRRNHGELSPHAAL
jgi:hypothetical protein